MSRVEQLREVEPRTDCTEPGLAAALRAAGHACVLGVSTRGGRWYLALGHRRERDGRRYYEDATDQEMAAATAAARGVLPDRVPRYKAQLEPVLERIARLSLSPTIYAAELADLAAEQADLEAKIAAAQANPQTTLERRL